MILRTRCGLGPETWVLILRLESSSGQAGRGKPVLLQKRDGGVDASFQFYDLDPKTGARRAITAREQVIRMLQEHSPVTHVTAGDPPTMLIHGDQDKVVPVQQSRRLIERLNDANVPARLVVRGGVGHAYPGWEADSTLIADWFDTHLGRVR